MVEAGARIVRKSVEIGVSPATAWAAVTDMTQMRRWSPEADAVTVLDEGPLRSGSRFRGQDVIGGKRWSTTCTVVTMEPERAFAFEVRAPWLVSRWTYEFASRGGGVRVTETWEDLRRGLPGVIAALVGRVYGVKDRATHNARTMQATLAALRQALEAQRGVSGEPGPDANGA